jgi:hypothetical protein
MKQNCVIIELASTHYMSREGVQGIVLENDEQAGWPQNPANFIDQSPPVANRDMMKNTNSRGDVEGGI